MYMKKILLLVLVTMASLQSKAQESSPSLFKGMQMIGGDMSYYSTSNKQAGNGNTFTDSKFHLTPKYGYMISNNWSIGTGIGYSSDVIKSTTVNGSSPGYTSEHKTTTGNFGINPYVNYYHKLTDKLYYSLSGELEFNSGSIKTNNTSTYINPITGLPSISNSTLKGNTSEIGIGITPGLTYFMNNHWAANINLGILQYSSTTTKYDDNIPKNIYNYFYFDYNLTHANLGVNYFFSCRGKKVLTH